MRRQVIIFGVFVLGYSLILGDDGSNSTIGQDTSYTTYTTVAQVWKNSSTTVGSSNTTNATYEYGTTNAAYESIINETGSSDYSNSTEAMNGTSIPLVPTTSPPAVSIDPWNNDTTGNNTVTSDGNNTVTSDGNHTVTSDGNNTTMSAGPPVNDTVSPTSSSSLNADPGAQKRTDEGQRFDTASFVGGIILAVGVVALGVFLFKVYQSRKGPRAEYNNI